MKIQDAPRSPARQPLTFLLVIFLWFVSILPARAQVTEIVKDFEQPDMFALATLVLANDGFLYGTTYKGGDNNEGTIFKIAVNGTGYQRLKSFQCGVAGNGCLPLAGMIQGADGFLYGTTQLGGANNEGTIFKIAPNGSAFSLLKSFQCGVADNGCSPQSGLIQGSDGFLYGTTAFGGPTDGGTLFKLATDGSGFTVLKSFQCDVANDSCHPAAGLVQGDNDGFLYGTTYNGGANGQGTVFKIATNGSGYTLLKSLQCGVATNGCLPIAGLALTSGSMLYGVTQSGGATDEGAIFKLASDGTGFALLKSFQCGTAGPGCLPASGIVALSDGNLYGTTTFGGASGGGTLYKLATDGTGFTLLDQFACDGDDSCKAEGVLTLANNGYLYSTASSGGKYGGGTIFRMPAPPTPNNGTVSGTTLTTDANSASQGSSAAVTWSAIVNPTAKDWIGLYATGTGNSSYLAWVYVSCSKAAVTAKATGTCSFGIPANLTTGTYEMRLLANNGFNLLATSNTFTLTSSVTNLPANGSTISVVQSTVTRGSPANVTWSGIASPSATDWIGLYAVGAPNSPFWDWAYVSCSRTPTAAKSSGTCTLTIPGNPPPGNYNLRLFSNNGFSLLATSNTIVLQ